MINATGLASVTVLGARPGGLVEVQGYSQDHFLTQSFDNDATPRDRSGVADQNGTVTFSDLRLSSNTRMRAQESGCSYGASAVIAVRTQLTLAVSGEGSVTFSDIVILYQSDQLKVKKPIPDPVISPG